MNRITPCALPHYLAGTHAQLIPSRDSASRRVERAEPAPMTLCASFGNEIIELALQGGPAEAATGGTRACARAVMKRTRGSSSADVACAILRAQRSASSQSRASIQV